MDQIQELFDRCHSQKTASHFKSLYSASSPRLYAVLLRILKQEQTAQDCLQEVFMKIWQKMDLYQAKHGSAITWMSTIARNHALDTLRRKNLLYFSDDLTYVPDDTETQVETLMQAEENSALYECIQQLTPEQQHCILQSYFQGLTYQRIADEMQRPVSTVKTWVKRSMPVLKKCLEQSYG